MGEMEHSGFDEPPALVRRADGQVIQLTELLYLTLEAVDGSRTHQAIAEHVSARLGRSATADNITFLLQNKLEPLGLLKLPDGSDPKLEKSNPLLALRWKLVLANERLTNRITAPFAQLFRRPIVVAVVLGFVAVATWVLLARGLAQGVREAMYSPELLLLVFGLTIMSAGFHEFGHAAACRYGGGRPGVMGAGIYIVWPAFYTDVTDAYRLGRAGRLRTDLGGLYFNAIFVLISVGVWAVTGWESLLLVVPLQLLQMLHQLMPVVRMDGYYILSDITGVPDLFARIKPTLASAVPGHETDERAARLKPWVRVVVTVWVLVVVPLLLLAMVMAVIVLPRVLATTWDSVLVQTDAMGAAIDRNDWLEWTVRVLSLGALVLPVAGTLYMIIRLGRRIAGRVWKLGEGRPAPRVAAAGVLVAGLIGLAVLWWPNGEYRPLQQGERGTLFDGAQTVAAIGSGRPGLTAERAVELDGAPSRRSTSETGSGVGTDDGDGQPGSDDPVPTTAPADPGVSTTVPASTSPSTTDARPTATSATPGAGPSTSTPSDRGSAPIAPSATPTVAVFPDTTLAPPASTEPASTTSASPTSSTTPSTTTTTTTTTTTSPTTTTTEVNP